jgi:hypothetical protein
MAMKIVLSLAFSGLAFQVQAGTDERLEALQASGTKASLTVYPVVLGERPIPQVGAVVGVMMEKAGLEDVGAEETVFQPSEGASLDEIVGAFGRFVKEQGIDRQYALYAQFLGTHSEGFTEVSAVLVDSDGNPVWIDRQVPGDADFDRIGPENPMSCCVLLTERLTGAMKLPEPAPEVAEKPGKLEQQMRRKSGIPEKAEFKEMDERVELLASRLSDSRVVIYPVRLAGQLSRDNAERLAELIEKSGAGRVSVAPEELPIEVARDMNEQKVLWSLARGFQNHVRQHPPDADYVLYADYLMARPEGPVGAVHFVLCDREGDWVIVDFQNSHHKDFRKIDPKSADDCDRLAAKRFSKYVH